MSSFYIMMNHKKNISSDMVYIYLVHTGKLNLLIIICCFFSISGLNWGTTLKIVRHLIQRIPNYVLPSSDICVALFDILLYFNIF